MAILTLDLGSTRWKAAIGTAERGLYAFADVDAPFVRGGDGRSQAEASTLWETIVGLAHSLPAAERQTVDAIALTGMAEGGALLDRQSGRVLTPVVPWYDQRSVSAFEQNAFADQYKNTGLPSSYKYGIFRVLAWKQDLNLHDRDICWLDVVSLTAHWLSGVMKTDPTLAARTYAYAIEKMAWDTDFLKSLSIPETVFPEVVPSGAAIGEVKPQIALELGISSKATVHVCGHDHVCAAYGAGVVSPGSVYGSMGTAQVMLGIREGNAISESDVASGLSFGPAILPGTQTVLGSIQSAGGSIAWARQALYGGAPYADMMSDVDRLPLEPSGLLYYPYLAGSGAPNLNIHARGTFLGLTADTNQAQMLLAIYEGIAMETRLVLERAQMAGPLTVSGGLTLHPRLMQAMADVLARPVQVSAQTEGTLYGAMRLMLAQKGHEYPPSGIAACYTTMEASGAYNRLYREVYSALQPQLLAAYEHMNGGKS